MWWSRPVILTLQSLRQEEHCEFKASLGDRGGLCQKTRVRVREQMRDEERGGGGRKREREKERGF